MIRIPQIVLIGCVLALTAGVKTGVLAQDDARQEIEAKESKYTLEINGAEDAELQPVVEIFKKNFQEVYPRLIKRFNNSKHPAPQKIVLNFQKGMDHPAHAAGNVLTFSTEWFLKNPGDIGVMAHELTHIVQHYPGGAPGWLVEGIADYSRFLYGPGGSWKLPAQVRSQESYTNAYRVTARFLLWIEKKYDRKFVDKANLKLQERKFQMEDFKTSTGKTVDELWKEYAADTAFKVEAPKAGKS